MPLNSELADFLASFTDPKWEVLASRLGGESGAADFLSLPLHFNPVGLRPFAKLMNGVEAQTKMLHAISELHRHSPRRFLDLGEEPQLYFPSLSVDLTVQYHTYGS